MFLFHNIQLTRMNHLIFVLFASSDKQSELVMRLSVIQNFSYMYKLRLSSPRKIASIFIRFKSFGVTSM